jgi:F420-dependent oxidoreductase-like protein
MKRSRLGITLPASSSISIPESIELIKLADRLGYDSVWVPETWGTDAGSILAILARETERIRICSGVFNIYSRSAMLLAQMAATLQAISGGRFVLGLGVSGPEVIENWHGVAFAHPLQRTREYIAALRLALNGDRVNFAGKIVKLQGFKLLNAPPVPVPIYVASLGPKNVRLTGEVADGWLPVFTVRGELNTLFSELEQGALISNRDVSNIDVAAYLPVASGPRGDDLLRQQIAYYVGGMGTFYNAFLSRLGFEQQTAKIQSLWTGHDRQAAAEAVPDSLVDACTLGSKPDITRARLEEFRIAGIRLPVLSVAAGSTAQEIADILRECAPAAGK